VIMRGLQSGGSYEQSVPFRAEKSPG
jgi:hypothetical protein